MLYNRCGSCIFSLTLTPTLTLMALTRARGVLVALRAVCRFVTRLQAHYPEQTATPRGGQMRYGPHVDSGAITMVAVDPASPLGLEVFLPEDEVWVDVCDAQDGLPPVEELLVLNCGATMARMTHGKWRSALHRVQNHPPRRLSIITSALSAKREAMLEVLPSCYTGDTPPHPPIKAKEFMDERAKLQRTDTKERASAELTQDVLEYRV